MSNFYDWQRTLSYNAPLTIVVGARGIGKTFGLRLQCIKDYLKHGWRFVEVFRFEKEKREAVRGYFEKLAQLEALAGFEFKSDGTGGYMRPIAEEGTKPAKWQRIAYFVSLSRAQDAKKHTFTNVKRIFLDEFILDRSNRFYRYLPREFSQFANIIDTVTREQAGDGSEPRAYLLGNSLDLINPYFAALGIDTAPKDGYQWKAGKTVLLHMAKKTDEEIEAKANETLTGKILRLAGDEEEQESALNNAFTIKGEDFIQKHRKVSRPILAIIWRGQGFTMWAAKDKLGEYHVRHGIAPECEANNRVYYFSKADAKIDYTAVRRGEKALGWLPDAYSKGRITFDAPALFEAFAQVLNYFGLAL